MGRHTCKISFSYQSAAYYKEEVFPDDEFLHATVKYAAHCISCTAIKPKNIINMKCALGFCYECSEYILPDEELDDGQNDSLVHFSVYTHQLRCAKHSIIPNIPTLY